MGSSLHGPGGFFAGRGGKLEFSNMRRGVVIACVGGLAAGALAISVALQPAAPSNSSTATIAAPVARHVRPQVASTRAARPARAEAAPAAVTTGILPAAYRMLLTKSIFSSGPVNAAQAHAASGSGVLALRGIMQQGRGFIAFVENTNSREAQQVRVGDTVGRGKIIDIDLHAVKYATGGRSMRVPVGQTFDGGSSNALTADPSSDAVATVRPE
jgi:hypothetical protein